MNIIDTWQVKLILVINLPIYNIKSHIWSQSYQKFFIEKLIFFPFFATKLGHFKAQATNTQA
jgi:hypothetical protein